jgi:hypothetical protein
VRHALGIGASLLTALCGCFFSAAPGRVEHAEASTAFIHDADAIYVASPGGLLSVDLDGNHRRPLFPQGLTVVDVSDDGARFVLRDAVGQLVLGDAAGQLRAVPLQGLLGDAALSPDGTQLAVLLLGQVKLERDERASDDALALVDTDTLAVKALPPERFGAVHTVAYSRDGHALWIQFADRGEVVRLPEGDRSIEENPLGPLRVRPLQRARHTCNGTQLLVGDEGIDLIGPDKVTRKLVHIAGRRRTLADTLPAIDTLFFSSSCGAVAFIFEGAVYATDVQSGRTGRLADGEDAFPAPVAATR